MYHYLSFISLSRNTWFREIIKSFWPCANLVPAIRFLIYIPARDLLSRFLTPGFKPLVYVLRVRLEHSSWLQVSTSCLDCSSLVLGVVPELISCLWVSCHWKVHCYIGILGCFKEVFEAIKRLILSKSDVCQHY